MSEPTSRKSAAGQPESWQPYPPPAAADGSSPDREQPAPAAAPQLPSENRLHLFDAYGVELEYMLAQRATLNVFPAVDRLIESECGSIQSEIEVKDLSWSNELALHVVELKTTVPAPSLSGLADRFQRHVRRIDGHLAGLEACLLPSAMHPWMHPDREMKLWPHEHSEIYDAFNRVFDCRGHGWANLQSVHLNLPFCGDEEFGRLHAAIRLVLPLLPAIAAASPVMDGNITGRLDNRLEVYRTNSRRVPEVCGKVIPERAFTQAEYDRMIFQPLYAAIAPLDPDGVLQDEFLNARGAIARFGRGSIEIRVIDIQECPAADLAVLQLCVAVLKALVDERLSSTAAQQAVEVEPLHTILLDTIRDGDQAVISDTGFLQLFGYTAETSCRAGRLWQYLAGVVAPETDAVTDGALDVILEQGPLARRLLTAIAGNVSPQNLKSVYSELARCLVEGRMFVPGDRP
ncbi:MAG: glutamate-cysteine ligase family protein [Fuerstiella sp.]